MSKVNVKQEVIGLIYRISKSTLFNITMLILGFILGVSSVKIHNHIEKDDPRNHESSFETETEK